MATFKLSERQAQAIAGLFYMRGKKIHRYARKPEYGTDAYIAGEAKTLALNPYRMPSEFVLLFNTEQQDFLFEMEKVWKAMSANLKDRTAEAQVEAAIRARYAK